VNAIEKARDRTADPAVQLARSKEGMH
jgi:hypothetical protein